MYLHQQSYLPALLLLSLPFLTTAHPTPDPQTPSTNTTDPSLLPPQLTGPLNGDLYPCKDPNYHIYEERTGKPPGITSQYQYNMIANLHARLATIAHDIPTAAFNQEISAGVQGQGRASMVNAEKVPGLPDPPLITMQEAALCADAVRESVREQAMRLAKLVDLEWSVLPARGPKIILAKGKYVGSPEAVGEDGPQVASA